MYINYTNEIECNLAKDLICGKPSDWEIIIDTSSDDIGEADMIGFVGVKSIRRKQAAMQAGVPFMHFDKAYNRDWPRWWRVCVNEAHPTAYMMQLKRHAGRALDQRWSFNGWRLDHGHAVLLAGSSAKYAAYVGAPHPTQWAEEMVSVYGGDRPVIYRPKPSWHDAVEIPGTKFSKGSKLNPIISDLKRSCLTVTHSSVAALESVLYGIPTITTGPGVTTHMENGADIQEAINALAMCQFNRGEIQSGYVFRHVMEVMNLELRKDL